MNTEEVVHKEQLRRAQRKPRLAKEAATYMEYRTCKSRENKGKGISFTPHQSYQALINVHSSQAFLPLKRSKKIRLLQLSYHPG